MISLIESIHAVPILAYLPRGREIATDTAVMEDEAYLFSLCKLNEKAKCFSTRPYFAEKIAKGETFKSGGHWEPAGHRTVAEAIQRYLVDEGYVTVPYLLERKDLIQSSSVSTRLKRSAVDPSERSMLSEE